MQKNALDRWMEYTIKLKRYPQVVPDIRIVALNPVPEQVYAQAR